jgi:hypothetical protein
MHGGEWSAARHPIHRAAQHAATSQREEETRMSAISSATGIGQKSVLAACPHDCPDTCSLVVTV